MPHSSGLGVCSPGRCLKLDTMKLLLRPFLAFALPGKQNFDTCMLCTMIGSLLEMAWLMTLCVFKNSISAQNGKSGP